MNKMVKIGTLCLIVALGLVFAGCDDVTKAEFASSVKKPQNVTWTVTPGGLMTVKCDIVKDALTYNLVFSSDDYLVSSGTTLSIEIVGGAYTGKVVGTFNTTSLSAVKGTPVKVGVLASSYQKDKDSAIGWAENAFTVP